MSEIATPGSVFVVVFVVGRYMIRAIPPLLHTPLMSLTNAVSGVTLVGAILLFESTPRDAPQLLAALAVSSAAFNLVGGFCVTGRMLAMFKKATEGHPDSQ